MCVHVHMLTAVIVFLMHSEAYLVVYVCHKIYLNQAEAYLVMYYKLYLMQTKAYLVIYIVMCISYLALFVVLCVSCTFMWFLRSGRLRSTKTTFLSRH